MADIVFDYSEIKSAKSKAEDIAGGWFSSGIDDYKSGLKSSLKSPLDEWRLSESEPYGHAYVSSAQGNIDTKISALDTAATKWTNLATKLGNFVQYVQDRDSDVVNIFETTSDQYTDYKGLKGVFNYISDVAYNFFAVDLANSNGFTRAIADWGKEKADDFSSVLQDVEDYFKHGDGRYILNIIGSVALTTVAIAGVVISIVGLPFTGGATCSTAVACISLLGVAAGTVSAAISAYNTKYAVKSNVEALIYTDDPGKARFYGDVSKYSEYVAKTDLGSKEANEKAEKKGKILDTTKAVADVVQLGTGLATTFGTKSVEVLDDAGNVAKHTTFDFSPSNVKTNVLKTFGFKATKESASVDVVEINQSTVISNADEIGDTTIDMTRATYDMDYKSSSFEKTVDIASDGTKTVTRSATFNKAEISTEYKSVVASNNVVTQEFSTYVAHAEASSTVIDYTNALSTVDDINKAKAVNDSAFVTVLKTIKETGENMNDAKDFLMASDEERLQNQIENLIKKNYFISQVDKYLFSYDSGDDNAYLFGSNGKKIFSNGKTLWNNIVGSES